MKHLLSLTFLAGLLFTSSAISSGPGGTNPVPPPPSTKSGFVLAASSITGPGGTNPVPPPPLIQGRPALKTAAA